MTGDLDRPLDRLLTHRVLGLAGFRGGDGRHVRFRVLAGRMSPMEWIDAGVGLARRAGWKASMAEGALRSLLVDGVIAGVGGVIIFLPQILILFLFIAVLEDCGYMARAAYLMDRLMARVGLSGKSFIPLLSSFACAIPGDHGHAGDRELARSAGDDPGRPADELQRPLAGVHAAGGGVHSRGVSIAKRVVRGHWGDSSARGGRDVLSRYRRRPQRWPWC